jgi:hypothetical protein
MSIAVSMVWQDVSTAVQRVYSSTGTGTETIPSGVATLICEVWGATGIGGKGKDAFDYQGGGGGSGGYCRTSISVAGHSGQTMTYTVGAAEVSASTVVSGTFTITSMTGPLGGNGGDASGSGGGSAGAAGAIGTGGTVANVTGNAGHPGYPNSDGNPGAGVVGVHGTGANGGRGSYLNTNNLGHDGLIIFNYK